MPNLLRTKLAYDSSLKHLEQTSSKGSDIESYLGQYLLVLLCAEMQVEVQKIISEKASIADDDLNNYIISSANNLLRSVKSSDLSGFLARFGGEIKEKYNKGIDDKVITMYNNAVNNRHKVAHKDGVKISFREIDDAIKASEEVLISIRTSLNL